MDQFSILLEIIFPILFIYFFLSYIIGGKKSAQKFVNKLANKNIKIWKFMSIISFIGIILSSLFTIFVIIIEIQLVFLLVSLTLFMIGIYYYIGLIRDLLMEDGKFRK